MSMTGARVKLLALMAPTLKYTQRVLVLSHPNAKLSKQSESFSSGFASQCFFHSLCTFSQSFLNLDSTSSALTRTDGGIVWSSSSCHLFSFGSSFLSRNETSSSSILNVLASCSFVRRPIDQVRGTVGNVRGRVRMKDHHLSRGEGSTGVLARSWRAYCRARWRETHWVAEKVVVKWEWYNSRRVLVLRSAEFGSLIKVVLGCKGKAVSVKKTCEGLMSVRRYHLWRRDHVLLQL
jgi:hypothetical protein